MAGGKLQHKKPAGAKDFADKQRGDVGGSQTGGRIDKSGQRQERGKIGQFTGAGDPGLQKK